MVRRINSTTDVEMEWLGEFGAGCRYPGVAGRGEGFNTSPSTIFAYAIRPQTAGIIRLNRPKSSEASGEVNNLSLSAVQSAILLSVGLQRKTVEEIETEISLPVSIVRGPLIVPLSFSSSSSSPT
ncbi:MAG: hypothetical protein NXY57DRAFT_1090473 [Lentinula lateritia]|nr:MAG: hypothetical protein NXY57DRAFT_1090473 [Lentinula lateritia]